MSSAASIAPATDNRVKAVLVAIKRHRGRPDALLEVLHTAQGVFGYLPTDVLWLIARQLKLPPSRVYGAATFYHFFTLKPRGEHTCVVCLGTACYIKGAPRVLAALEAEAGVVAGGTTPDGKVSVQSARCLGTCGIAPVVIYDSTVVGHETPESAAQRIREWLGNGPR
jgi:bidirectional [NiFe] hydrogenase diaphorase subunit